MKNILKKYWLLLIILSTVGFFFTSRLGRDLLWDWDECIYAGYATSMKLSGNFFHNVWNGMSIFDKPPLYIWILQLPLLIKNNEFFLRLPTVVGSLTLLTAIYVFSERFFSRRVAVLAALLMLTGEVFIIYSTKITTDIFFTLFIFLACMSWLFTRKAVSTGLFFGLAMMVKGPGVAPYMLALFLTLFLNIKRSHFVDFFKMVVMFLVIGLPWHLYAFLTHGKEFVQMYAIDNLYKRSTFPIEFHRERAWFYFTLLYRELSPWLFAVIVFPLLNVKKYFEGIRKEIVKNQIVYTLILLIILPLLSITKVQTRIAWYILPLYPFIAIYLAYCLNLALDFVSEKFPKKKRYLVLNTLYFILVTLLILDAGRLILNETKFNKSERTIEPRYEVILEARKQPQSSLNYLVAYGERQAPIILPPEEELTYTWWYGGNACAVYYSEKKVNYFYEEKEFGNVLNKGNGLFLISNLDSKYSEGKKILFRNSEYTLFTQQP